MMQKLEDETIKDIVSLKQSTSQLVYAVENLERTISRINKYDQQLNALISHYNSEPELRKHIRELEQELMKAKKPKAKAKAKKKIKAKLKPNKKKSARNS